MATSTNCPSPVRSACRTAATIPTASNAAGKMSPMPGPDLIGVPSAVPVTLRNPPIAWATTSNAGHET